MVTVEGCWLGDVLGGIESSEMSEGKNLDRWIVVGPGLELLMFR